MSSELVGLVIGYHGRTLHNIQRLCSSFVHVDTASVSAEGTAAVKVKGPSKSAVDWSKILVEAVMEFTWLRFSMIPFCGPTAAKDRRPIVA